MNNIFKWVLIVSSTFLIFYLSFIAIEKVHFPLGKARLKLHVQCSIDNIFKVYYTHSSEFSAKKMIQVKLKGNAEFQDIEFPLPSSFTADKFRLFVGTEETPIKIKYIELISENSGKTFQWNSENVFNNFKPTQLIKSYVSKAGYVEIIPNGENVYLENVQDISPIIESTMDNSLNRFKPIIYSFLLAVFFMAIMYHLLFPVSSIKREIIPNGKKVYLKNVQDVSPVMESTMDNSLKV